MTRRLGFVAAAAAFSLCAGAAQADGAAAYRRCAVCHLPSGEGVPGAYPPLAGRVAELAATAEGRAYVILAPSRGVGGAMEVKGVAYRGFMPAQSGLTAGELADLLNYAGQALGGGAKDFQPFTAAEVEATLKQHAAAQPGDVAALRPATPAVAGGR
jgi:hypothetical protein